MYELRFQQNLFFPLFFINQIEIIKLHKALVEFAPQHSTRQIVNPSELPIDQIVTSATSHTNILPTVYFAVKARMTNHKIILQTFERSAALQRVERLRLYMSRGEIQNDMLHQERDLFEEHRHALLRLAQRQNDYVKYSKSVNIVVAQLRCIASRSLCEYISRSRN
ncbi:unnamed protein product [Rotaria sp. Silwood2]|nr:unnamed protein product [Rotaria sp. Silwood2]